MTEAPQWSWAPKMGEPELTFGKGRAPRMMYYAWHPTQGTELGATAQNAWYRRCKRPGCCVWAGPYKNASEAKRDGIHHLWDTHNDWEGEVEGC